MPSSHPSKTPDSKPQSQRTMSHSPLLLEDVEFEQGPLEDSSDEEYPTGWYQ